MYEQARAGLGEQFSTEIGSMVDAVIFANSIVLARAKEVAEAAALQRLPQHVSFLMPQREAEYGIVPSPDATMKDRAEEYARRFRAVQSTNKVSTEDALREVLGSDFLKLHIVAATDAVTLSQVDGLDINYQLPLVNRKFIRLESAVSTGLGVAQFVFFSFVLTSTSALTVNELVAGDQLMVEPGALGLAEKVTVTKVKENAFEAVFTKPHSAKSLCTTMPYPGWATTKRHATIIVTEEAALNPEKRRVVDQLMRIYARDTSTWDIAAADGAVVKTFKIGTPAIGIATTANIAI